MEASPLRDDAARCGFLAAHGRDVIAIRRAGRAGPAVGGAGGDWLVYIGDTAASMPEAFVNQRDSEKEAAGNSRLYLPRTCN